MFSFEIESQVTWNSLPILPSIFGLSSQNIVIPHYSCHSDESKLSLLQISLMANLKLFKLILSILNICLQTFQQLSKIGSIDNSQYISCELYGVFYFTLFYHMLELVYFRIYLGWIKKGGAKECHNFRVQHSMCHTFSTIYWSVQNWANYRNVWTFLVLPDWKINRYRYVSVWK